MSRLRHALKRHVRRPRLLIAAVIGVLVFLVLLPTQPVEFALVVAFDVSAGFFLMMIGVLMTQATEATMRHRARLQDDNKWVVLFMGLLVAGVVVLSLSNELHAAKNKSIDTIIMASVTILCAWLFVAVQFAQQYAHDFYMKPGQLVFPGTETPDYWDFTYFAVVLSMCCQTSDVVVTSSSLRRLVLLHSVISFFFNVIIIAITVSVVAGVL
jgi:uncharacterized membrane protein